MNALMTLTVLVLAADADPEQLVKEANQLLSEDDHDGAIGKYARAQPERQNSPEIDIGLGLAHAGRGDHDKAAEYFETATAKGLGRLASIAKYNLGNSRVAQGRFEDALEAYEAALKADDTNEDARVNLEIVRRHIDELKKAEEERKKNEEEFKKRLEELMKELRALVEEQSKAVAQTWESEPSSSGPVASQADAEELKQIAEQNGTVGEDLAARLTRSLVKARAIEVDPVTSNEMSATERMLSGRAHDAAETAGVLAADLRHAAGQSQQQPPPPPPQPGQQAPPQNPPQNPMIDKLERAGGAAEEAAGKLNRASGALQVGTADGWRAAEPHAALALWKLLKALGELAQPPQQSKNEMDEALKELLKRMAELRRRQGLLVLDIWQSYPTSRGEMPTPDGQKELWQKIRDGQTWDEDERRLMSRVELAASGMTGRKADADEIAKEQANLADDASGLTADVEALAAKAGGDGTQQLAPLLQMLRTAAAVMDEVVAALRMKPIAAEKDAEHSAVTAFARLSRVPGQLDELLARLGAMLAEQTGRVLDTWKSDPTSIGALPTREEVEQLQEAARSGQQAPPTVPPETEAKLGRAMVASVDKATGGKAGVVRRNDEAAGMQRELVGRTSEIAEDMRRLASSGGQGQQNEAAPMLSEAAKDVDAATLHMEKATDSLPASFVQSEPPQVRAVAALARAFARFSSGASGQSEQKDDQQQDQQQQQGEQDEKEKSDKKDEQQEQQGEKQDGQQQDRDEKDKSDKDKEISEKQAERLLEEASQEEREVRRDLRKRKGGREVEVKWDW